MLSNTRASFLLAGSLAGMCVLLQSGDAVADADTIGNIVENVPASACSVVPLSDGSPDTKITLSNGSWVFRSGVTGTSHLWCPVHTNHAEQGDFLGFGKMRLWYKDTDGSVYGANLTASLWERQPTAAAHSQLGGYLNSSTDASTGNNLIETSIDEGAVDALYYVYITMYQTNGVPGLAQFNGIDFEADPNP